MSYTPPTPVVFEFDAAYLAPLGASVNFNLGVSEKDAYGVIDYTVGDVTGVFVGNLPQRHTGAISAILGDCTGIISAAYLDKPLSFCFSVSAKSGAAKPVSLSTNAHVKPAKPIETAARFEIKTALKRWRNSLSKNQQADVLLKNCVSRLQTADMIRKNVKHHATDLHEYTHKFDSNLFKEPPPQYRYTPAALFDFGVSLNERVLSTTTQEYVAGLPVAFDLTDALSSVANFDLGLTQTQPVTHSRTIFDNVSTYQPQTRFIYGFASDSRALNHSYQRAALRLGTAGGVNRAKVFDKNYRFKIQNALKLARALAQRSQTARKIRGDVRFTLSKAVKLSKRYRFVFKTAKPFWNSPPNAGGTIVDPPRPPIVIPPDHVTVTIPTRQVYRMQHTISVTLENLTPIDVDGVSLALDSDSFAWSFSANLLNLNQLDLVKQPTNAPPVTLIITIDGTVFKMLVEKITRNRSFAKNSISLSGRSLSALLSSPYEQPRSATQSSIMTVQQLANLELPDGWTINWTAPTWNVPSGAFSYTSKTPIQVISEIAASIGAIVVPSRNAKVLNVMPRYRVLPWNFDASAPDLVIPDSAIVSLSYRNIVPTQANAVYVHGSEIGGVLSRCRLTGTAGDRLSATVTNALMTDVIGCRALGEMILANAYEQPAIQSISMSMGGEFPLVGIGDFVRINIDGGQVRGVVNSVAIAASLDKVSQTVQIGNESTNVWTQFKEIMPSSPLLVGTVASVSGETSLMTLIDGGVIRCRGVGGVGEKWYIRGGALESKAPSLTLSEIVI